MNIPEENKLEPNMAVVFKKHFEFRGVKFNAVMQTDNGEMIFFDTDAYYTDGELKIAVKDLMEKK